MSSVRAVSCHRLLVAGCCAGVIALGAAHARGAGPLGARGDPITTSSYHIDYFQGPVLASSRVTGLGGAYAGIAEGVEADAVNAAAPAMRVPWSVDWFDYDLTAGISFPSLLRKTDFDNNGSAGFSFKDFYFLQAGGNMQLGAWGFGALADMQTYHLQGLPPVTGLPPNLHVTLIKGHALASRALLDGQLIMGAGIRIAQLRFTASEDSTGARGSQDLLTMTGAGPEAGIIWAPHRLPLRVGVSGRFPVQSKADPTSPTTPNAQGDTVIGAMYLPDTVQLPWELEAGIAVQLGPRPLNVPWVNPNEVVAQLREQIAQAREQRLGNGVSAKDDAALRKIEDDRLKASKRDARARLKARDHALPRNRWLLSSSVLITGPVADAVGVESFLEQRVDRSGQRVSITPRVGLEAEPVGGWLKLRAGSYLEPTRFREGAPRLHGTFGFDVKLLNWSVFGIWDEDTYWRVGGFVDGTRGYLGWGVSVGVWH
jgi:hypothetical protein